MALTSHIFKQVFLICDMKRLKPRELVCISKFLRMMGKTFLLAMFFHFSLTSAALVQMRLVKDTASYGYFGSNIGETDNHNQLVLSVQPANFTGPNLMQRLVGKCYNLTEDRYRYVFCPFQSITQYELSSRWNAYQGILGIWSHWNIENNTFTSMIYSHGDHCGDIDRTVEVFLKCGPKEELSNVTEPNKCQYSAIFSTRYACHRDAVLVYPRLNSELQQDWDQLLTQLYNGEITEKGYHSGLQTLFQSAGLLESPTTTKAHENAVSEVTLEAGSTFTDLLSCNKEYKNLQNEISQLHTEIEGLKLLLDISNVQSRTKKPQK